MADKKILLVEDNPDDEMLTIRAFKQNNLKNEIVVAHDGVEAVDYLFGEGTYKGRNVADVPSIILLDLNLPKLNGIDVLKRIREDPRTEFIPVIVLTTSKQDEDMIRSYRNRANSYIQKPVNFPDFIGAVNQLGVYWLVLNEIPRRSPQ